MEEDEILKYSMQIAMLKQLLRKELINEKITVNAAPGAAAVYRSLGFAETAGEQHDHGMRYLPMARPVYHERGKEL